MTKTHAEEHDNGDNHAAAGSDNGQQSLLASRQLATEHLTLDLQTYAQEEEEHEEVVDEVHQRERVATMTEEIEAANAERDGLLPQPRIEVAGRGQVREDERQHSSDDQEHTGADIASD